MLVKRNNFIFPLIIFLYLIFIYRYKLFDLNYLFLVGDFYFSFNPEYALKSYLFINEDPIKYTFWIIYKILNYLFIDFLRVSIPITNRLTLLIPAFFFVWSFFVLVKNFFNEKYGFLILFLTLFLFTTSNFLQLVDPIGFWLPFASVYLIYFYFAKDMNNMKYDKVIIVSLLSTVTILQPRLIFFLAYFLPIYGFLILKVKTKTKIFFLIKYFLLISLLSILFNFYTIFTFFHYLIYENNSTISHVNNLFSSRSEFIYQYTFSNSSIIYLLSFYINSYNPHANLINNNFIILLSTYIFFLFYVISILDIFKKNINSEKKIYLKIFLIFFIFIFFFTTPFLQDIYLKIPFLWTISSPTYILLLFLPFTFYLFINGILAGSNFLKKKLFSKLYILLISFSLLIYIFPFLFSQTNYINKKFYQKANESDAKIFASHNVFEQGWINIPKDYFEFYSKIDKKNFKILHFPLAVDTYVNYNFTDLKIPVVFNFYTGLNLVTVYEKFRNELVYSDNIYLWNSSRIVKFLKDRNYKYIVLDFNHRQDNYDDMYLVHVDFFYLIDKKSIKKIFSSNSYDIYELL